MIPQYTKIHNRFKINNSAYSREELKEVAYSHVKEGKPFESSIGNFLIDWLDDKPYVAVTTSGSTGIPKKIELQKQAMVHSAIATGDFFDLNPGDNALHCLPSDFIAGKMMLVRAMILGLEIDIVEPTSQPVFDYTKNYDFCAMLPMQLDKTKSHCQHIKTIIVGGASVSESLKMKLQALSTHVFETYGMTETITHIAVKPLNHTESIYFKTLPNVSLSQDDRECLIINAPYLSKAPIVTNDIVKLYSETEFEWLGRFDNIINSGGKKLIPERIESILGTQIQKRFFVASEPDDILGECLILIIESQSNDLKSDAITGLSKHEIPKKIYSIPQFIETESGKVDRKKTLALLK